MEFIAAKEFVEGLNRFGSVLGLANIKMLLRKLNNPEKNLNIIHVAGTNGKGSTITYLEGILLENGHTCGKYTSPVVFDYLEKYQINGKSISEEEFAELVEAVMPSIKELNEEGIFPTIFEVETAMAFMLFKKKKISVALLETGMGGDSDATNVAEKVLLSIITSISLDHTTFLGNTIEEIAAHKAGIIKKGCPVIISGKCGKAVSVIKKVAENMGSRLIVSEIVNTKEGSYIASDGTEFSELSSKLKGKYQEENMAVAIEAALMLNKAYPDKFDVTVEQIKKGIKEAFIPGRFEKISDTPEIYIDGAHNPDAILKLKTTIKEKFPEKKIVFIMGVLADKDYESECREIADVASEIITVTPDNGRALEGSVLMKTLVKYNKNVSFEPDLNNAYDKAIKKNPDVIIAFGSLSYLGSFKKIVTDRAREAGNK
ncbi:MAG: bifunctional folylpolyglutamate synthase/dihydrofolate synthase [Lachnospiraceae bacterium]|nr:bifunctional folylpolyglutamate synthase/dihydrofolate synthase [Lachnospiraceae bacterium]